MTTRITPNALAPLAASPHVDALYIKDPGGLADAQRAPGR